MSDDSKKGWHDQLKQVSTSLFGGDDIAAWVDREYQKISDVMDPHPRLLTTAEKFGIVQLPIIIGKGYISNMAWRFLESEGFELEWVMARYTTVKNCRLLGISVEMKEESAQKFASALDSLQELDSSLAGLGISGKIRQKGQHLYAPLFIGKLIGEGEITISEWDFLT